MSPVITLFIWFIFYSFLGWVWETTYCSIKAHRFINRGFLNGPVIPVYGFGALLVMTVLTLLPFSTISQPLPLGSLPLVFLFGMILCTILEYITAVILETAFHIRWWDYSKQKFNFQGRICLKSSLFFGIGSVVILYILQPIVTLVTETAGGISADIAYPIAGILLLLLLADIGLTLSSLLHVKAHLQGIRDDIDTHRTQLLRLIRAFPTSVSQKYDIAWLRVKDHVWR